MRELHTNDRINSGIQVVADFTIELPEPDSLEPNQPQLNGIIVFNLQGGCMFFNGGMQVNAKQRLYADSNLTTVTKLELIAHGEKHPINQLKLKMIAEKTRASHYGIMVKFAHLTEQQLQKIKSLLQILPTVDSDDEVFPVARRVA